MWAFATLFEVPPGDLTAYVHIDLNIILFFEGPALVCAAINRRDIYVICGASAEPPCALTELYIDFAERYHDPLCAGFGSPVQLDEDGYFESILETPWDDHPLFCAKKIYAAVCFEINTRLPMPIAEEIIEHIFGKKRA